MGGEGDDYDDSLWRRAKVTGEYSAGERKTNDLLK